MEPLIVGKEHTPPENKALVYNTRFGDVKLREDRLIGFPTGILGFSTCTIFGLSRLPDADESPLLLLQCVNEPSVGFLVADPDILGLEIKKEDRIEAIRDTGMDPENTQFLVVLTMYDQGDNYYLTANLRAPLMVDSLKRQGRQHILANKAYTTQHKL